MKNKRFILLFLLLPFLMFNKDYLAQQLSVVTVVNGAGTCSGSQILQVAFGQSLSGTSGTQFTAGFWNPVVIGDISTQVYNENPEMVTNYMLAQNYPNPFNPVTKIKYALPFESFVEIKVYNVLGQEIRVLENSVKPVGYYEVIFDCLNLSSGTYIYVINAKAINGKDSFYKVKKLLLIK